MARKYEPGDAQYLIETSNPQGETLVVWALDQRVANQHDERSWDNLDNQVEAHLNDLSIRTGCRYRVLVRGAKHYVWYLHSTFNVTEA